MFKHVFRLLISVRAKLVFSFMVIGLIMVAIGLYASRAITQTGQSVIKTYDNSVQASTHAESARFLFSRIETSLINKSLELRKGQQVDLADINVLLNNFTENLNIVAEKSANPEAKPYIQTTRTLVNSWKQDISARSPHYDNQIYARYEGLFQTIYINLDKISELQVIDGQNKRKVAQTATQHTVSNIKLFVCSALILAIALALWLSFTILNPLNTAVNVAKKVSDGDYDVLIPQGRKDETGLLLASMSVMQNNIRSLLTRERHAKETAEDNLTAALKNSEDAILIASSGRKIMLANEKVKALFPGLIDETFIGGDFSRYFNDAGHPIKGTQQTFAENNEIRLDNGTWAQINASEMEDGGRLFIWNDITNLKTREEHLRVAKDKAEAANKSKTLFLASMSHELRTPLNAVIGFSDLMAKESLGPLGDPEYVELSEHILESGQNLLAMIEDVLVVAGTRDESRETLDFETLPLIPFIEAAIKDIKTKCAERNIGIIWNKPETAYTLDCNTQRLKRVLSALFSNAVKFNKDSGFIKVSLKDAPESFGQAGVFIDITDTGIGISQDDLKKVMAPFVQADNSYKRAYEGAGLGLAIASQWTKLHGGKISIASKLGKGTVVRLFLPAQQMEASNIVHQDEVVEDNQLGRTA